MRYTIKINRIKIPDTELLSDIKSTARKLGVPSITATEYRKHGKFHDSTITKRFNSWNNALAECGMTPICRTSEIMVEIRADIKAVSVKLGKTSFSCYEYERNGKFRYAKIKRYYRNWGSALSDAGLKYVKPSPPDKNAMLENLENIWNTLGRQPNHNEIKKPLSSFGKNSYVKYFGSWHKALKAFALYLRRQNKKADLVCRKRSPAKANCDSTNPPKHTTPRNVDYRMRLTVFKRDSYKCRLCGRSPATDRGVMLQIDHIIPWSSGGETILDNLQTLCMECNIGKGDL